MNSVLQLINVNVRVFLRDLINDRYFKVARANGKEKHSSACSVAGNDVLVLSPLGDAANDFLLQNWKGQPRLYIKV